MAYVYIVLWAQTIWCVCVSESVFVYTHMRERELASAGLL